MVPSLVASDFSSRPQGDLTDKNFEGRQSMPINNYSAAFGLSDISKTPQTSNNFVMNKMVIN